MSMYDCAVCNEPRCEHVIEEMDKMAQKIKFLESKQNKSLVEQCKAKDKWINELLKALEGLNDYYESMKGVESLIENAKKALDFPDYEKPGAIDPGESCLDCIEYRMKCDC